MKRILKKSRGAVAIEHPDGGVFHILPMTYEQALAYAELVTREEFERDKGGALIFDQRGKPVKRYAGMSTTIEQLDFAASLVDHVDEIENEDGSTFVATTESMRELLTLMGSDDVELEIGIDAEGNEVTDPENQKQVGTKKVTRPVRENIFLWVLRKSAKLAAELNEVARKN